MNLSLVPTTQKQQIASKIIGVVSFIGIIASQLLSWKIPFSHLIIDILSLIVLVTTSPQAKAIEQDIEK